VDSVAPWASGTRSAGLNEIEVYGLPAPTLAENNAANATVGTAAATGDPDAGATHTFDLVSGTGDTDNAAFTLSSAGVLSINDPTNYEVKTSYSIRVRATDNGSPGLSYEKAFTISVTNVNEAVLTVALTGSSVTEHLATNTTVGTFSSTDTDTGNSHSYSLVSGTGSDDNASFNISGNTLRTTAVFDFETKSSYTIRVRSTDQGGLFTEQDFAITILDANDTALGPGAQHCADRREQHPWSHRRHFQHHGSRTQVRPTPTPWWAAPAASTTAASASPATNSSSTSAPTLKPSPPMPFACAPRTMGPV